MLPWERTIVRQRCSPPSSKTYIKKTGILGFWNHQTDTINPFKEEIRYHCSPEKGVLQIEIFIWNLGALSVKDLHYVIE